MKSYRYQKIDAFTSGTSLGNPAACLYLTGDQQLSEKEMLDIAKQHKGFVSEVIYCKCDERHIYLTYYSSECEVDFCGHGTIASMYSLIKNDPYLLGQKEILVQTNRKGSLTVYNQISEQDAILITAPQPIYLGTQVTADMAAKQLGVSGGTLDLALPVELIDAGLRTLIVPFNELDKVISVFPEELPLKRFCEVNDIDIILIFSRDPGNPDHIAHTRVFAPRFGYLEDPATGSGNSAFGYYMLKHGLWDGGSCSIEQGGSDRIYNNIHLSCRDGRVLFGGSASVRINGVYYL